LTALQFQAEGLLEIADILFVTPVEARRRFGRIPTERRQWFKKNWAELYRDRQQFQRTLQYLKRQGLVARKGEISGSWTITRPGLERLKRYETVRGNPFSKTYTTFLKPYGNGITIVAYDIPERERRRRDWIRLCLVEMGCEMIQKSVWVARGTIDENFIRALHERDLLGDVHVFAVTKQGTIRLGAP
jgi:DNA-binding transcriptional regulator PaaX